MAELDETWLPDFRRVRIGINTGRAVLGLIGPIGRMNYMAVGDTVTLAHRVQDLTKEYMATILITSDTKDQAGYLSGIRQVASIVVKGKSKSTDLYDVINLKAEVG